MNNTNNNNNNNTNNKNNEDIDDENDLTPLDNEEYMDDRSNYDDEDEDDENSYDNTTNNNNSTLNNTSSLQNKDRQRKSRGHQKKNTDENDCNNTSSQRSNNSTRSSSSPNQSRSMSPSYQDDSTTSFPNLAAVAAANGIDSTTAILAAQSLLSQQTPGLSFPTLAATGLLGDVVHDGKEGSKKRRTDRTEMMSERIKKIKPVPADKKDDAYWERRRKNNEAAKRSRDLRRQKEDEIAVRASFLEQENLKLKAQVTILKAELSKLHFMLYNR
jgi:hypothetical protein